MMQLAQGLDDAQVTAATINYLKTALPPHYAGKEADLFAFLRQRCLQEDRLAAILARLMAGKGAHGVLSWCRIHSEIRFVLGFPRILATKVRWQHASVKFAPDHRCEDAHFLPQPKQPANLCPHSP
jgi:hypothetical protein